MRTYQIAETIGSGGAERVFKGVSLIDHAPVAIKVLHSPDPYIRQKFREEGEIGFRLRHPHIVHIYEYGEEADTYYIIMEYVDGGSLRHRLVTGAPASFDFVRSVIGQTCEALAYSHNYRVIHRDIKPENILFSSSGGVKVTGFGRAESTSATTKTSEGIVIGTAYYIPYEQAAGEEVTPASDIYSLGIVLYEMLTGEWPFTGAPLQVIDKHLNQKPIPPRQLNPNIPPEIETAVMRALEKDPRRRYQNAMHLARDLGYQPAPGTWHPWLVVISGGADGKRIPLNQAVVAMRRSDIDPNDPLISRGRHFRVIQQDGQFYVEDEGSRHGTYLNGKRIEGRAAMRSGDMIQVGRTMLRFDA
ncbi:MAG: protein kinase [Chloroflexi bacterium]|nr:protein kinase [Chloroflexota bacterium]